jgi:ABC-2 type transport system ATP-binding protein
VNTTAPRSAAPSAPVITAEEVSVVFGDHRAVDAVSLDVEPGSIVGLIGPSGSGKTTLVRVLLGILAPSAGTVRVFGRAPGELSSADRNRLAYMPQMPVLFPNLSVIGNLSFIASLYGVPLRGRRRHLRSLLEFVDLEDHARKRLADCSGGMQRRLSLAATLVHQPEVLFLDEPTAGVDPILRERFWARFRELRNGGHTIVVPTQYVGEAVSCDRVAIVSDGHLIAFSAPDDLRRDAFHGHTMRLRLEHGWIPDSELDRLSAASGVTAVRRMDDDLLVVATDPQRAGSELRSLLAAQGVTVTEFEPVEPSMDQVFVELVERHRAHLASVQEPVS